MISPQITDSVKDLDPTEMVLSWALASCVDVTNKHKQIHKAQHTLNATLQYLNWYFEKELSIKYSLLRVDEGFHKGGCRLVE